MQRKRRKRRFSLRFSFRFHFRSKISKPSFLSFQIAFFRPRFYHVYMRYAITRVIKSSFFVIRCILSSTECVSLYVTQHVHDDNKNISKFSFHVRKNRGFVRFERRLDSFHVGLFKALRFRFVRVFGYYVSFASLISTVDAPQANVFDLD